MVVGMCWYLNNTVYVPHLPILHSYSFSTAHFPFETRQPQPPNLSGPTLWSTITREWKTTIFKRKHIFNLDLLKMLGKSKKYSPKWWYNSELPWYKVKSKNLTFNKSKTKALNSIQILAQHLRMIMAIHQASCGIGNASFKYSLGHWTLT